MARQLIEKTIRNFLNTVTDNDIYNEFSMQHELGIKLREEFEKYNTANNCHFVVQFERNRTFFNINNPSNTNPNTNIPKSEIDIVVYDKNDTEDKTKWKKYAIELKYPLKSQGKEPERMYEFFEDVSFCEKLKNGGFTSAFAVVLTNNPNIYSCTSTRSLVTQYPYNHFRSSSISMPLKSEHNQNGAITKPTGEQPKIGFTIEGTYNEKWESAQGIKNGKYYIISI